MTAYEIAVVIVLLVLFILLSLLPFLDNEEDLDVRDLFDRDTDLPHSWIGAYRR